MCLFLKRREGKDKEKETNTDRLPLLHPLLGTWPTTQARALLGNQTGHFLICKQALNPLSHTSQGDTNFQRQKVRWVSYVERKCI